jgi:hypothetical protein
MPEPHEADPLASDLPPSKPRAWPAGLLLSIAQIAVVWGLMAIFTRQAGAISGLAFWLHVLELIAGIVWWNGNFKYQGRVAVFAALFPVALVAVILLVWSGICLIQGKGIGG